MLSEVPQVTIVALLAALTLFALIDVPSTLRSGEMDSVKMGWEKWRPWCSSS